MDKKRVAICFFGQVRTFRVLDELYKTLSSDKFDVDYFISTWDDFNDKFKFDFCTKKEFIKPDIIKFKNNTDRAAYTIFRVNNLKSRFEIDNNFIYDCVVWTRSEILFKEDSLINLLEDKIFNCEDYEINTLSSIKVNKQKIPHLPLDYFYLGSSLAFDLYSTGWKSYFKSKKKPYVGQTYGGHTFHPHCILKNNLKLNEVNIPNKFLFNQTKQREIK